MRLSRVRVQFLYELVPLFGGKLMQFMAPNDVGRLGQLEEIAAAVAYLAIPVTDYVSGAAIRVDGGTVRSAF